MNDITRSIDVLHVDDEPAIAELVGDALERASEHVIVESTTDPEAALARFEDGDFDCLVSDYDMPGMTGLELLSAVRERDEMVPFVLFTGKGSEEIASEAISAGVTDYLQKETSPEQFELLANRVEHAVSQYRVQQRAAEVERRYAALFEHTSDAIAWVEYEDGVPVIQDANPAFEAMFVPDDEDAVGRDIDEVVAGADQRDEAREISDRVRRGQSMSGAFTRETVDGAERLHWEAIPVQAPDGDEATAALTVYSRRSQRELLTR